MANETKGKCKFCDSFLSKEPTEEGSVVWFECPICGSVALTKEALERFFIKSNTFCLMCRAYRIASIPLR